jgi:hypothetical protein
MSNLNLTDYAVSQTIDLVSFSFLLFGVWVLGSLVAFHYNKFFPSLSRSQSMGKTLIIIATITFLIISVVKSSLALSLGLVGALSIIRFRTPIKEPFELSYLFMSIAIGLGFGASQWMPTTLVIVVSLIILTFYSTYSNKLSDSSYFVYIDFSKLLDSDQIKEILIDLENNINIDLNLRRLDQTKSSTKLTINAKVASKEELLILNKELNNLFNPDSLSIVDSQKLMPF